MHRYATILLTAVLAGSFLGCAGRGNVELLESRLRLQEDQLLELQSTLGRTRSELHASRAECDGLRQQIVRSSDKRIQAELPVDAFRAAGIRFQPMLTGTVDRDSVSGDDHLTAMLTPHDGQGDLVKLPGRLELKLVDLSAPPDRQTVGHWEFDAAESRRLWHSGFLGSGYLLRLSLGQPVDATPQAAGRQASFSQRTDALRAMPTGDRQLILHARLVTADEREFVATHEIRAKLPELADRDLAAAEEALSSDRPGIVRLSEPVNEPVPMPPAEREKNPFEVGGPGTAGGRPGGEPVHTSDRFTDVTMPQYR